MILSTLVPPGKYTAYWDAKKGCFTISKGTYRGKTIFYRPIYIDKPTSGLYTINVKTPTLNELF